DADEEILQDFLVEAGEILELLSEQLVELESSPDDAALLNAIFRGFHTVKGGAGFLQLHELVECCHIAEDVFDILRKGERRVDSELMEVVLEALDAVIAMFCQVRERSEVPPASPELLAALARLAEPAGEAAPEPVATPESVVPAVVEQAFEPVEEPVAQGDAGADEITDDEFEALLDQLHGKGQFAAEPIAPAAAPVAQSAAAPASDEITDEEFEALLDQLHGKGQFAEPAVAPEPEPVTAEAVPSAAGGDEITDDEFEALLDQLHGKGKFEPEAAKLPETPAPAPVAAVAPKPAPAKATPAKPAAPVKAAAPAPEKVASEAETTVRVDTARLDEIMNMVGELVL